MPNAVRLSRRQSAALLAAVWRELAWGLRLTAIELRRWRVLASAVPDPLLRRDALHALDAKRGHSVGAGLFWTLTGTRNRGLLRVLVAYDVLYDYLDEIGERVAAEPATRTLQLERALHDALAPGCVAVAPLDDGGYLQALLDCCRSGCARFPHFAVVEPALVRETRRLEVLALNHLPDPVARDAALREWAEREFAGERHGLEWWELTAASSQSVVTFALLALAADPHATREQAEAVHAAYFPWFALAVTMLDAWVDQEEDERCGAHSYVAHYPSREAAAARLCETVERAAAAQLALPQGERHTVLLACMVAMYLSKDSARAPELREASARIVAAGGSLTRLLLPVLRLWRIANGQTRLT